MQWITEKKKAIEIRKNILIKWKIELSGNYLKIKNSRFHWIFRSLALNLAKYDENDIDIDQ